MQKRLPFFIHQQSLGVWAIGRQAHQIDVPTPAKIKSPPAPMNEVADATVLSVGYGSIGKAIETRLAAFGATFLRAARSPREGEGPWRQLDERLGPADIVVLTIPLTSETRHLLNTKCNSDLGR